jgi:hypothetical protein
MAVKLAGEAMSWVFFLLLSLYVCARLCLRARGAVRVAFQRGAAAPREMKPVPEHVALRDVDVWTALEDLAARLDKGRRALTHVRAVDPDAAFGIVRDGQYRITAIETRQAIEAWLRGWDALDPSVQIDLRGRGIDDAPIRALLDRALPAARRAFKARALEPFPLHDVDTLLFVQRDLLTLVERYEHILSALGRDPYRADIPMPRASPPANALNHSRPALA